MKKWSIYNRCTDKYLEIEGDSIKDGIIRTGIQNVVKEFAYGGFVSDWSLEMNESIGKVILAIMLNDSEDKPLLLSIDGSKEEI